MRVEESVVKSRSRWQTSDGSFSMTDLRFAATRTIAYFSMEVGLEPGLPTYSGGLGVLAGDTSACGRRPGRARWSASRCCTAAATFASTSTPAGRQSESPVSWEPAARARAARARACTSRSKAAASRCGRGVTVVRGVDGRRGAGVLPRHRPRRRTTRAIAQLTAPPLRRRRRATGCARKRCSASAASPCCGPWATSRFARTT